MPDECILIYVKNKYLFEFFGIKMIYIISQSY